MESLSQNNEIKRIKIMKKIFLYIGVATLLSSCHIYQSYERPDVNVDKLFGSDIEATIDSTSLGDVAWQAFFTDAKLQILVEKGLEANADLKAARSTVTQARAGLMASRLAYLPSLALSPQGQVTSVDHGKAVQTYSLPVVSSWQIDVFGNLLNANRSAKSQWQAAKDYQQAVQSQVIAGIANTYFTLVMLNKQIEVTDEAVGLWEKTVKSTQALMDAGMANRAAVAQTESAYQQAQMTLETLKLNLTQTENAMSLLLHEKPGHYDVGMLSDQTFDDSLVVSYPAQILSNRPDVRAAERSLQMYYYNVNVARSQFYPSINLSGSAGWSNSLGTAIVNPGQLVASAIASLTQPLFANGKLVANLRVAKAQYDDAVTSFEQSILQAGADVNNALASCQAAKKNTVSVAKQVAASKIAFDVTQKTMQYGNTTYLEVITAQQSYLSAQLSQVSQWYKEANGMISLWTALGGGSQIEK